MLLCCPKHLTSADRIVDHEHLPVVVVAVLKLKRDTRINQPLHHSTQGSGDIGIQLCENNGSNDDGSPSSVRKGTNRGVSVLDQVVRHSRPHAAPFETDAGLTECVPDLHERFRTAGRHHFDIEHHTTSMEGSTMTSVDRLLAM